MSARPPSPPSLHHRPTRCRPPPNAAALLLRPLPFVTPVPAPGPSPSMCIYKSVYRHIYLFISLRPPLPSPALRGRCRRLPPGRWRLNTAHLRGAGGGGGGAGGGQGRREAPLSAARAPRFSRLAPRLPSPPSLVEGFCPAGGGGGDEAAGRVTQKARSARLWRCDRLPRALGKVCAWKNEKINKR